MELRKALIGLLIICAGVFVFVISIRSINATASTGHNHRPTRQDAALAKTTPGLAMPHNSGAQQRRGQAIDIDTTVSSRNSTDAVKKEPNSSQWEADEIEIEPGEIRLPQFYRWDEQPAIGEEYSLSVDQ